MFAFTIAHGMPEIKAFIKQSLKLMDSGLHHFHAPK
jgi:hypothetical protein